MSTAHPVVVALDPVRLAELRANGVDRCLSFAVVRSVDAGVSAR